MHWRGRAEQPVSQSNQAENRTSNIGRAFWDGMMYDECPATVAYMDGIGMCSYPYPYTEAQTVHYKGVRSSGELSERDRQPQAITGNRQRKLIINQRSEPIPSSEEEASEGGGDYRLYPSSYPFSDGSAILEPREWFMLASPRSQT